MNDFLHTSTELFSRPFESPILVFGLMLFMMLIAPILFNKLKVPGLVGLILSGILIGPYGLKLIEVNSVINLFSQIGLLYIMFIVGLELNMNEFRLNKNRSIVFGLFTFFIPLIIGFPVCFYVLKFDFYASLLLATIFSTHTLVSYPIVSQMGLARNKAVSITVGGTIVTDAAVLLLLELILKGSSGSFSVLFLLKMFISTLLFAGVVFFLIPRIANFFLHKMENEKYAHYIFVLFVLFFASFLAEISGLEPMLGAFAAGLALNRYIPHTSALMNRIEFIGNAFFIPIFFISVGMMINIHDAFSSLWTLYIAGLLLVVALLGKWLAAYFTQRIYRLSYLQRELIFGLSCAHLAATLAVILVGFKAGIIGEDALNGVIILILVTSFISSFVTQNTSKRMLQLKEQKETSEVNETFFLSEKILLPIADPSNIGKLVNFSLLIKSTKSENPVSLLSIFPNEEEVETRILVHREKLQEYVNAAAAAEKKVELLAAIDYNVISGITRVARETMSSIVILGWPGKHHAFIDKLFGDTFDGVISSLDKNIFICLFLRKITLHKRILMFAPPLCEREGGFSVWRKKLLNMASDLSKQIHVYCNSDTQEALCKKRFLSGLFLFESDVQWNRQEWLKENVNDDDLLIIVSAKPGQISYQSYMDQIPLTIERLFSSNSRIVVYPRQTDYRMNII